MRKPKVYDVYSYGKHIFTGTRQEIAEQTGLAVSTLGNIVSHGHKQYRLEPIGKLEPVYALYERDVYVASGTVQELAGMVGMNAKHLNWRQFDSVKNMGINYRYHIYKLEGEYEVVRETSFKWEEKVYEVKRGDLIHTGTPQQISEELSVRKDYAANFGKCIGVRYPMLKAVSVETLEVSYGNVEEISEFTGLSVNHIKKIMTNARRQSPSWDITLTGKYKVDLIGADKPKIQKPTAGHVDIKPVYTHKPVPMSEYGKQLFEHTFRKWA